MNILDKIDGLEAKFHEVSLLITDPSVIADQASYVRLNREYHDLERNLTFVPYYFCTGHGGVHYQGVSSFGYEW